MITLYRGISVPKIDESQIREDIMNYGLSKVGAEISTISEQLANEMLNKKILNFDDLRHNPMSITHPYTYASADERVGNFYAVRESTEEKTSLLITFKVNIDDLLIDGRDFLYNIFQKNIDNEKEYTLRRNILNLIYGPHILQYYDKTIESSDFKHCVSCADLAIQDKEVIAFHSKNEILIEGRFNVPISSIFHVRLPILSTNIISVAPAKSPILPYQYKFSDFL